MVEAAVEVRSLTKQFQRTVAVDNVSFDIRKGEIFGLLGPNGAGKTTTLRMLCGLIAPTSGEAFIAGKRVHEKNSDARKSIGFLTEVPGFYDRLSAWHNLIFFARLYGVTDAAARATKYLKTFQLWDRRKTPVGTFSKGMKQKLALVRALLHEPPVLLLDEPTSGLDPQMQKTVRDCISDLRDSQRTVLICTHNLGEAEKLCDRVAVLNTRLIATDTTSALRRNIFGSSVRILLQSMQEKFLNVARQLPFVSAVRNDGNALIVSVSDPHAENPELVRALVYAGAEIISVSEQEYSLEEVYLTLMERPG